MEKKCECESRLARLEAENEALRARLDEVEEELSNGVITDAIVDALAGATPLMIRAVWDEKGLAWVRTVVNRLYERLKADDDANWWKGGTDGP